MSTHLSVAEIFRKLEERMKLHEERPRSTRSRRPITGNVAGCREHPGGALSGGRYAWRHPRA
jgi:hypothetical protein